MAAQEKAKQSQAKPPPPPAAPAPKEDILSQFDAPNTAPPPPAFDAAVLPPQPATVAPPSFSVVEQQQNFPAPPAIEPLAAPSAPTFDLLDMGGGGNNTAQQVTPMAPPPPPPQQSSSNNDTMGIDEDVLAALDPAERAALIDEQRQILAQIEEAKKQDQASSAAARALAFDQRSNTAAAAAAGALETMPTRSSSSKKKAPPKYSSTTSSSAGATTTVDLGAGERAPLHGQEKTKQAIQDGTAVLCQCVNCQSWMQVTDNATLMFCPNCQVVSPVIIPEGNVDLEAAAQLSADQELAERLQREEYAKAEGPTRKVKKKAVVKQPKKDEGQSWYDWLVGNPDQAEVAVPARGSAELPSRVRNSNSKPSGGGLTAATTGEETGIISYSSREEDNYAGGPRVAESKSMFACVADSITMAATEMMGGENEDDHGVDTTSLLAMPQVSRQRD